LILITVGVLWATGVFGGSSTTPSGQSSQPSDDSSNESDTPSAYTGPRPGDFFKAATKGTPEEKAKFRGKPFELMGQVFQVGVFGDGDLIVLYPEAGVGSEIGCFTREPKPWLQVTPPRRVIVKGRWDESYPRPTLVDCEIVKVFGPSPPTWTADELAKKFTTNRITIATEIGSKWLYLTGTVARNEGEKIILQTSGDQVVIECSFFTEQPGQERAKAQVRACTPGTQVKILGSFYQSGSGEAPKAGVSSGIVVEPAP
jgi:hypothetical protein